MKVCFFLGSLKVNGGIGRVTSMLANELAQESSLKVQILSYFKEDKPNIYPVIEQVEQCFLLGSYCSMAKLIVAGGVAKLKSFIKENKVDVLVACGALFFPLAVLACRGTETRCICWEHTSPTQNSDYRGQALCRKFGIKRSDLNVVLTESALRTYLEKYNAKNTVHIYNPVDKQVTRSARDYNVNSKRIISVGRLTYQKNFQAAIAIAERILPSHPEWSWDIFGQGEEFNELATLIQQKGLTEQMHLCGQVDDLYDRYYQYAIMVMTSRYEGFSMALLEGLGNGLPLVSFDIETGPDEIIQEGVNGFLIQFDDIQSMANKVELLMDAPEMRSKMSSASLMRAPDFGTDNISHQWRNLLSIMK